MSMLLISEEGERIQAIVTQKHILDRYRDNSTEGSIVFIANFNVVENNQYKATNHPYEIMFNTNTFLDEEKADILWNSFSFMPINVILEQKVAPEYVIDVIGMLKSIGKLEEYKTTNGSQNKLTFTLSDKYGVCMLLGDCASSTYYSYLDNTKFPLVFVIHLCRLNIEKVPWKTPHQTTDVGPTQTIQVSMGSMLRSTKKILIADIPKMEVGKPFIIECIMKKLETGLGWKYEGCIGVEASTDPTLKVLWSALHALTI
ncbi:uncharacterized protein LOC129304134 [Prosopis cineraria]|uniref:uncharacterized protein LOC129304134 n=1 Tax=Prosopis cineraria TaxID=364024 RepID=UPI00240FD2D1|nr:uncharacterized protein LOC129304134 [Prosopis cineraria]